MIIAAHLIAAALAVQSGPWSDPSTWGGAVPTGDEDVIVPAGVTVDLSGEPDRVGLVDVYGSLVLTPGADSHLRLTGSLVVRDSGTLATVSGSGEHRITFEEVDEAAFVGGGMSVVEGDIGLWVEPLGTWMAIGRPKRGWTRASAPIDAGDTVIVVDDASGWEVGDLLTIAPTDPPTVPGFTTRFEERTIVAVTAGEVEIDAPVSWTHACVREFCAEVANLSRSVIVEGTPTGRAHVLLLMPLAPVMLSHVLIQHTGPRQVGAGGALYFVPGRYGLHLHHGNDGPAGSVIDGVVVARSRSHAFVPHEVDDVTFTDTVSYDTAEDAYWWDPPDASGSQQSNGLVWQHVAALLVQHNNVSGPERRLTGFNLRGGIGHVIEDAVAVGVQGRVESSGYLWPEATPSTSMHWQTDGLVAHNNVAMGFFGWQNNNIASGGHEISDWTIYHVGECGIGWGAYRNGYRFSRGRIVGAKRCGLEVSAGSAHPTMASYREIEIDGEGITVDAVQLKKHHQVPAYGAMVALDVHDLAPTGHLVASAYIYPAVATMDDRWAMLGWTFDVPQERWFLLSDLQWPTTELRFVGPTGYLYRIYPTTATADCPVVADWNAKACYTDEAVLSIAGRASLPGAP